MNLLILCVLRALLAPLAALASTSEGNATPPTICYFQYTARYGEKAVRPGAYRAVSFQLMNNRIDIFGIPPSGADFSGLTGDATGRELAALTAGLDFAGWEGVSSGDDPPIGQEQDAVCIWTLNITFAGDARPRIKLSGHDDGRSLKRLATEAALLRFFTAQRDVGLAGTPRRIESLYYHIAQADGNLFYYNLDAEVGKVRLSRTLGEDAIKAYVTPELLPRTLELLQKHRIDDWNGFGKAQARQNSSATFSIWIKFDTEQTISAKGNPKLPEEMPPNFAEADTALRSLFDTALGLAAAVPPQDVPTGPIRAFDFFDTGMSSYIHYKVYQCRDLQGVPRLLLRRQIDRNPDEAVEVPFTSECAAGLKNVIRQHAIADWNGFQRSNTYVLDGNSFSLFILLADGVSISASGNNAFPKGYQDGEKAMLRYLDQCIDNALR